MHAIAAASEAVFDGGRLVVDHLLPLTAVAGGSSIGVLCTGWTLSQSCMESRSDLIPDKSCSKLDFIPNVSYSRILDPVVFEDYPPEMSRYHGNELPRFSLEERVLLRDSIDFIGLNHYASLYAKDSINSRCICNDSSCIQGSDRAIRGFVYTTVLQSEMSMTTSCSFFLLTGNSLAFVVPRGIEEIVSYAEKRYQNKTMFVTENGYSSPDNQVEDYQHDVKRINYHKSYLAFLALAIRNGADVRGYFIWSLIDDFE
ncbi:Beta-glucosidase 47 [Abeliophyllum distichum]|uniref:Beta-glucosidase 47 n=1 Tax=Abeliophyllum distichum TaxID=126358 RepID=A0ABD1QKP9_9LAMI